MKVTRWPPWMQLVVGLLLTGLLAALPFVLLGAARRARRAGRPRRLLNWLSRGALSAMTAALFDALLIEPFRLTITRHTFRLPAIPPGTRLRLVHLSDLHIYHRLRRHRQWIAAVAAERPDLIVITGDLLQDDGDPAAARALFTALSDLAPTVMVLGNHERIPPVTSRRWALLRNDVCLLSLQGVPVRVIGWEETAEDWQPPALGLDDTRVNIVLTHTPDWFPEAAAQGAELALAGHTHGGQVRLPGWGAVLTNSRLGKRFEYGAYRVGRMYAFVSRGISQETWPLPPMRFCCPPEIAVITLEGETAARPNSAG